MNVRYLNVVVTSAAIAALGASLPASAETARHHVRHAQTASAERPLTINGHRGRGIYRVGNDIIAPGGFSAHGYGYPVATAEERREARNARIRQDATGPYGNGIDPLAGYPYGTQPGVGYDNPAWGNSFSTYVGIDGVPSDLAFGPGYANRYIADHDPIDDDDEPGPTPRDLGYSPASDE